VKASQLSLHCRLCVRDYPVGVLSARNRKLLSLMKVICRRVFEQNPQCKQKSQAIDVCLLYTFTLNLPCRYRRCTAIALFLTSMFLFLCSSTNGHVCWSQRLTQRPHDTQLLQNNHIWWTHNCGSSNWQPGNTCTRHSVNTFDMPYIAVLCTRKGNNYTEGNFVRIPWHRTP